MKFLVVFQNSIKTPNRRGVKQKELYAKLCPMRPGVGSAAASLCLRQKKTLEKSVFFCIGGEAEIRTLGGLAPTTVFKTAALNRSATSPK